MKRKLQQLSLWLGRVLVGWGTPSIAFSTVPFVPLSPYDAEFLRSVFIVPPKSTADAEEAVRKAQERVGLPSEVYDPDFDLSRTGKLYEVIHFASEILSIDHSLRTSRDVVRLLTE